MGTVPVSRHFTFTFYIYDLSRSQSLSNGLYEPPSSVYDFTFFLTVCYLLLICTCKLLLSVITESRIIFEI